MVLSLSLPSLGDRIPVERLHVSKCNVRFSEPFGESEEDREFVEHLKFNAIRVPLEARPEGDGFGVYIGRRRFLAKKDFTTHFVVGRDLLIFDVTEEEAREASFIENNEWLKKNMDALTYAENLNQIVSSGGSSIRATARRLGMSAGGLSEYLTLLGGLPSQKFRDTARKLDLPYKGRGNTVAYSMLGIAKLGLDVEKLDELAEVLLNKGRADYYAKVDLLTTGKRKRGLPKDAYDVFRVTWKKANKYERKYSETISRAAKNGGLSEPEYIKRFLVDHMDEIEKEALYS